MLETIKPEVTEFSSSVDVLRIKGRVGDSFYDFILANTSSNPVVTASKTTLGDSFSQKINIFDLEEKMFYKEMTYIYVNQENKEILHDIFDMFNKLRTLVD